MESKNKLTLQELIKRKESIKSKKNERRDLYIKSLDATITIEKQSRDLFLEAADAEDTDVYIVYNSVIEPNLKDTDLHKAFGVVSPPEIVDAIFQPGEIPMISKEVFSLSGFSNDNVQVVEELKN
jgi:hypothetical protein